MNNRWIFTCLLLTGCANSPSLTSTQFGEALKQSMQLQTVEVTHDKAGWATTDGLAAKAAVDRYQKSFELPPPASNVFTIGVGTGAR